MPDDAPATPAHCHALRIRDTYYASTDTITHTHPTAHPTTHTHAGTDTISYGIAEPIPIPIPGLGADVRAAKLPRERRESAKVPAASHPANPPGLN